MLKRLICQLINNDSDIQNDIILKNLFNPFNPGSDEEKIKKG